MNKKTIYFIAKEAGVSVATISRFFNNKSVLKKETKEKIKEICEKYNYKPSNVASAITTKKTKSIALLVPSLKEPFFNELVHAVESKLANMGYCLNIFNTRESIERELEVLDIINNRIIDGVIISGIFGGGEDEKLILELNKRNIPSIFVDRYIHNNNVPYVAVDDYQGGEIAARYLLESNHKSFGIVTYDLKINVFNERKRGFFDILNKNGLKSGFVLELPAKFGTLKDEIDKKKDFILNKKVSAIFATTDMIAIYLLNFFISNNIKVPEEVSIIGFDNIVFSALINPKLTTIDHNIHELGAIAAESLVNKIEKNKYTKKQIIIKPEIVERESVKRI